jgi:O-Antigen ligase
MGAGFRDAGSVRKQSSSRKRPRRNENERPPLTLDAARTLTASRAGTTGGTVARWSAGVAAFGPVFGLAIAQGGYFPAAWGWASIPLLWTAAVALVLRNRLQLSRPEQVFLAALAAFGAWIALSIAWSVAPAESVLETERVLVYIAAALAVLVLARAGSARHILGGLLAAVSLIAAFALATRLLPDRVGVFDGTGVYRLAQPIGYWNGLALFAAMGAILAFGFAVRGRSIVVRASCAALLVLLLPTMYFTYGRGAWAALALGVLAAVAADPRRLLLIAGLLALAPAPALAVLLASRERGLTHEGSTLALAAHDGHRLLLAIVVLAGANAAVSTALVLGERRLQIGPGTRRAFAIALSALALAAVTGGLVAYRGPVRVVQRAYDSFKAPLQQSTNLNSRLLNLSGHGRAEMWRLGWDEAVRHPLLGAGAGSYGRYFLAHQPTTVTFVRDAHSLYVETLSELGAVGLGLLALVLLTPFAALGRARRHPLVPAAIGAYVAYLVHTGVDWDWELPAVTLVGLLCAAVIVLAARGEAAEASTPIGPAGRWILAGAAVAAATFATVGLIGNTALSRSSEALSHGDISRAATDARRARTLMPWSPQPWVALGRVELRAGLLGDARNSFRKAVSIDSGDWALWAQLAAVTTGPEQAGALARVRALAPLVESGP